LTGKDWSTFVRSCDSRYDICNWNSNWFGSYRQTTWITNINMRKRTEELICINYALNMHLINIYTAYTNNNRFKLNG